MYSLLYTKLLVNIVDQSSPKIKYLFLFLLRFAVGKPWFLFFWKSGCHNYASVFGHHRYSLVLQRLWSLNVFVPTCHHADYWEVRSVVMHYLEVVGEGRLAFESFFAIWTKERTRFGVYLHVSIQFPSVFTIFTTNFAYLHR